MKRVILVSSLILLSFLLGCSQNLPGQDVCIDWVDTLQMNGIRYTGYRYSVYLPDTSMVGEEIGKISFQISGAVTDPSYQLKDGDATYLKKGTSVYQLKGFDPKKVVTARDQAQWVIYFSEGSFVPDPFPETDIDKAASVVLLSQPGNIVGEITDKPKIEKFIDFIKTAETTEENFDYSQGNPSYYFYVVIPDEGTGYKLPTLHYIEFDSATLKGFVEGLYTNPGLYDLLTEHTYK